MDNPTVVVIESDPDTTLLISRVLQEEGFAVRAAASGPDGVEAARNSIPVLVTTEQSLPGFDGQEVVRRIRLFSNVPILFISASNDLLDVQAGLGAGADGYVLKPFSPDLLGARVRALLRRPF